MNQGYAPNVYRRPPVQRYYKKPKNDKKKVTIIVGVILGLVVLIIAFGLYRLKKNGVELTKVTVNDVKYMVNGVINDVKSLGKKNGGNSATDASAISGEYDESDSTVKSASEGQPVTLNGDSIEFSGTGATVNNSVFTITAAGTYTFSGTLNNGQIIVEAGDQDKVELVLSGANISCANSAAINIKNADKTVISLENDTDNAISDGKTYSDTSEEAPTAAIYSKDDLTLNGEGSLTVNGNYDNGIKSTNDLKITGGNITVTSVQNGVVGKDSFSINNGTLSVTASADGIKANNEEEEGQGQVIIEGGTITVKANEDGIQAESLLAISGGNISVQSGGKAIKSTIDLNISGGELNLSSSDDTLHSNSNISINGGKAILSAEDDGIHADSTLTISEGNIRINKSYEGLEAAVINIKGGTTCLASSDDGVNAGGGNDSSSGGMDQFSTQSGVEVNILGGYLYVNAQGDGLDSNGNLTISGGTIVVNGPTANNNGALDANGDIKVTGGLLVAAGSLGMAETPDTGSTQYSISLGFSSTQSAGSMVNVADSNGNSIVAFAPAKNYQSLIISSPNIKNGASYTVSTGGSYSTKSADGLHTGGTYSGGTTLTTLTISSIVTSYGNSSSGGGPGGFGPGGFR